MENLHIPITGDSSNFRSALQSARDGVRQTAKQIEDSGMTIEQMFDRIKVAAAASLAGFSVKEFASKVMEVRGEFQKLEVAFNTMLGSAEKADALMQQLVKTAAITPFDLKGVADGAKQLMAYGIAADEVNDTLIHLGDIAAGLSLPLGDLVYLYGTTMTQGRMFTQDLRQFMGRGIPLAEELAKQFGVTKDKVGELVTAGKVGADEFKKAIMAMSSEGGKFAGLMEAQSKTISGQISNIEDAIDVMFNNIGKQSEGIINGALSVTSSLVENYETVGRVIMGAVIAIGTYKTALITANAIEKASISIKQAMAVQEALLAAEARNLAAARGISIAAAKAELGSVNVLKVAKMRLTAATKALTASMMANPYTAVAAALAVVAVGVYKLATAEGVETAARRKANEEMQTFADKLDEQQNKIKGYIQTIQDETATEYQKAVAWEMLNKMAPTLTEKYDKAAMATLDLAEATKELNEQADKANYEHIRDEVQKWKETIDRINQNMLDDARYTGGKNALFNLQQLEGAEAQLDTYLKKLAEIDRIRAKMAEDAKPIEIRIKEANENVKAKQEIYGFYKRAADLAGELKNAHDEAAGVIANSGIPYNYEAIADQTKEKYDALITELEADVEDLRTRIAESPASLELEQELKGKEKALDDLISMKQQWAWSGATTIPLNFIMNFSQVETALQNAKNGQGINTQGMRFNGPTGTWVKDEATAPATMTASQWRMDAYNNWKQAQAAVDAFWNKKEEMDKATFDKEYDRLKGIADKAKKEYDKLKGDSSRSNAAKQAEEAYKKRQRLFDQQMADIERRRKQQQDMEEAQADLTIASEQSRARRELMQMEKDHKDKLKAIDRQAEEMRKANYEAQKKAWESANTDKTKSWADTDIAKSVAEQGYKVIALTETQNETLKALREKENADYARYFEERLKIEDGSRQAVIDAMEDGTAKEIAQLNLDKELKLKAVKEQYEELKEAKEASARAVAEANGEMFDPSSVDFSDIDEWYKKQLKAIAASYSKSMGEIKENNQSSLDQLVLQYGQYADKKAVIERQGEEKIEKLRKQYTAATTEEERRRISEMIMLTEEGTEKQLEQLDDEYDKTKEKVDKLTIALGETIQTVTELGSAMKDLFDIDEADYAKLTKGLKSVQSLAEGVGKIKTGDYLGGGLGILSGLMNAMSLLSGDDDSYRQQVLERIDRHLEVSNKNIEKLTETFEKSYGITAWKLGEKAATELTKSVSEVLRALSQMDDLPQRLKEALGTVGGGGRDYDSTGLPGHGSGWNTGNKRSGEGALDYDWIKDNKKAITEAINALNNPAYTLSDDAKKYLEELEKLLEQIDELKKSINERLTGTTAKNVYDDFLNSLYDIADGSEDVMDDIADNWQKMVNRMVVNNIVGESFRKQLTETKGDQKSWYDRMAELQHQFSEGIIDNTAYREAMKSLMDEYNGYVADAQGQIQTLTEEGIIKPIGEAKKYFSSLRDAWLSTLTDMGATTKDFKKQILDMMFEDLVNDVVLGAKLTVNTTEGEEEFKDFAAYLEDWRVRYKVVMEDATLTDEQRIAALKKLADEQAGVRDEMVKTTEEVAASIGKNKEISNALDNLADTFLNTLTDMDADAKQMGKDIAVALIKEMLSEMLASEKYATQIDAIKKMWQKVLNGERDEEGNLYTLESVLKAIDELFADIGKNADITALTDKINELTKATNESESAFAGMRDTFLDTLTDIEGDAEKFKENLVKILTKDLIEKLVLDVPLTLDVTRRGEDGTIGKIEGKAYDNFNAYSDDWNKAYLDGMKELQEAQKALNEARASGDEEAIAAAEAHYNAASTYIDTLIDELVALEVMTAEEAKKFTERMKKAAQDTTFTDMESNFVSALMDMEGDVKDFANDIGQTMAQKIIEQMIAPTMIQPLLDNIQKAFNDAMATNTTSDAEGNAVYNWKGVLNDEGLKASITALQDAYPELKDVVQQILSLSGVKPDFSNSLDSIGDTLLDRLLSLDDDVEDIGKQIGQTLIREMLEQMLSTGQYADRIAAIKKMWQAILTGEDTEHTIEDVLKDIEQLENDITNPENSDFSGLIAKYKSLADVAKEGFSDLRGAFLSSLIDMNGDAETFGKSIGRTMLEQMLDAYVERTYKEQIAAINKEWAEALQSGNTDALERIKQKVQELYSTISTDVEVSNIADAIKELDKQLDTTFSDMADSWASALMDMEGTAEDWTQSVGKMIAEKIIKSMAIPTMIQPLLNDMQKAWNAAAEQEGATYQTMLDAIMPYLSDLVGAYEELRPIADYILNSLGVYKETVEELKEEVEYALQDMKDNFVSDLMDMEATAEKRAESISRIIAENFIKNFVLGDAFDAQMEQWQQHYESILNSGLSEDERARQLKLLRDAIASAKEGYVEQAMAIQELLGLNATNSNQTATANIADKITYEQADMGLGMLMALVMNSEQMLATVRGGVTVFNGGDAASYQAKMATANGEETGRQIESMLLGLANLNIPDGDTVREIRGLIIIGNSYLYDIKTSNEQMLRQFGERLESIDNKIGQIF